MVGILVKITERNKVLAKGKGWEERERVVGMDSVELLKKYSKIGVRETDIQTGTDRQADRQTKQTDRQR